MPTLRPGALRLHFATAAPAENRLGQDVVEDLVARTRVAALVDRAENSLPSQRCHHRPGLRLRQPREARQVGGPVRHLRSRRSHQVLEHARGGVLLAGVENGHRAVEVFPDDRTCAAQLVERRGSKNVRAALALLVPHPFHHELEVRGLDAARLLGDGGLSENGFDKRRLDVDPLVPGNELVPATDRPDDRRRRGGVVERLDAKVVREDVGDPHLEHVEARERVVAE